MIWMVRAGRGGIYAEDFLNNSYVAIGWNLGPESVTLSKSQLEMRYRSVYPDSSDGQVNNAVGQIDTFFRKLQIGDKVTTYDREKRHYLLGEIRSAPSYEPSNIEDLCLIRNVDWTDKVPKDSLKTATRNTLGAIQTVFQIKGDAAADLLANAITLGLETPDVLSIPTRKEIEDSRINEDLIRAELLEKAEEGIEDRIARLDWEEMQQLVAGILRAMGYKTDISPRGSDRGSIFLPPRMVWDWKSLEFSLK